MIIREESDESLFYDFTPVSMISDRGDFYDNHRIDDPDAGTPVQLLLERFALVEEFRTKHARLDAGIENVVFQLQFRGEVCGAVAPDGAPCVGQLSFGDFGRDIGAFEKLFQQVAHQHRLGPSHRAPSFPSDVLYQMYFASYRHHY